MEGLINMKSTATIYLTPGQFEPKETEFINSGELKASLFRFHSGVCAVRLKNKLGELVMLPFQGQQIWSADMCGRPLTMVGMFDQPQPTRSFLDTYGAFMLHCGATAMGVPGPEDSHPLHGELPNAPYQSAFLELGEDEQGAYIGLGGSYRHTVAFNYNYLAEPMLKLYAGSSIFNVSMKVTNLKKSPMPLMYLAHINFRPVDNGRLVYTAICDPEHMRVRADVPSFMEVPPGYREFLQDIKAHPEKHMLLKPGLQFDPEVVIFLDYLADEQGWAHALQLHPDQSADVVRHRPEQLNHALRWMCRTPDQDAIGFEPATAEGTGFNSEKKKGNVRFLPGQGVFQCDLQIGVLSAAEALKEEELVQKVTSGSAGK